MTNLFAQDKKNPNGTYSETVSIPWDGYWMPIFCDGVLTDFLFGTVTVYYTTHYMGGIALWADYHTIGEALSKDYGDIKGTGEVFMVKENDFKQYFVQGNYPPFLTVHFNFIGNKGSHYQGVVTMDASAWLPDPSAVTVIKFMCH